MQLINIGAPISGAASPVPKLPTGAIAAPYAPTTSGISTVNREFNVLFTPLYNMTVDQIVTYENASTDDAYKVAVKDSAGAVLAQTAEITGGSSIAYVYTDISDTSLIAGESYYFSLIAAAAQLARMNTIIEASPIIMADIKFPSQSNDGCWYTSNAYDGNFDTTIPDNAHSVNTTSPYFGLRIA